MLSDMYDVRRLTLLVQLRRSGTIAAVGDVLHYSPSGVSQQLAVLESEVGSTLLERVGRGVRLTRAGEILCDHAETVIQQLKAAEADIAALHHSVKGTVRFAAFQTFNLAFLPDLIAHFKDQPSMRITLHQLEPEVSLPLLRDGRFDAVVTESFTAADPSIPLDLRAERLLEEPMHLAVPVASPIEALDQAGGDAWALEPRGTQSRSWATALCRSAGFEPEVPFETDDLLTQLALVRSGVAVSLLPGLIERVAPLAGVRLIPLAGELRRISLVTTSGSDRYAVIAAVVDALRHLVSADPTGRGGGRLEREEGTVPHP